MTKRVRRIILVALGLALAGYFLLCVAARLLYPRVLFPAPRLDAPPAHVASTIGRIGGPVLLTLPQAGGPATRALYFAPPATDGRVIVLFHGNGATMFDEIPTAEWLRTLGMGALLVEYRGYGLSYGPPPEEDALYDDGEAALRWAAENGVGKDQIALWGISLGTGVAAELARRGRATRLVLIAPFTSTLDIGRRIAPWMPVRLVMAHRFETLAKASAIHVPTLVVHGDADEVIPFAMGEQVAGAIAGARLVAVRGGHHNDLFAAVGAGSPSGEELLSIIARHLQAP